MRMYIGKLVRTMQPELYYVHSDNVFVRKVCVYGDQDNYTTPIYAKLKVRESSKLAEVLSAGAVWSVCL